GTLPVARTLRAPPFLVPGLTATLTFAKSMTSSFFLISDEQRANRVAVMNAFDRLAQQPGDAENPDLRAGFDVVPDRDGVGDQELLDRRRHDAFERRRRQHAVGRAREHR